MLVAQANRRSTEDVGNHDTHRTLGALSGPRVFGFTRWRKDWVDVSSGLVQGRRAWGASVRDVVNSVGDAGSNLPE